jgi:hypothetical protein
LHVAAISVSSGGTLDVTDNDSIFTATPLAAVEALVASGRTPSGSWTGVGITSSLAAAGAAAGTHALAVATAGETGFDIASFAGQSVAASDVLVKYTYSGDANLDGAVNFDDFNKFLGGFANSEVNPARWFTGDFNYDGFVNFDDFNKFLAGFNYYNVNGQVELSPSGRGNFEGAALGEVSAVPEPAVGVLALSAVAMLRRRRRKA